MYLGIEIGGTKLQLGVGPGDGTLAGLWRGAVDVAAGGEGIRRQILAAVPELLATSGLQRSDIVAVGVGFGGPVEDATRTVIKSHQIEGWDGFPLADWLTELLNWDVALGNDADVAGLAEALFGAGKGLSPIFYITIGSGIGGGLIIDGEIYRGCGRGAAEIGHLRVMVQHVDPVGPGDLQSFPSVSLESVASGWAIERRANMLVGHQDRNQTLLDQMPGSAERRLIVRDVGWAAAQGDEFARRVLQLSWEVLAEGICHVITLLCPQRIVIGGGVSLLGEDVLFRPLREQVAKRVFQPFANCYDIVPAALGEEVVIQGALALAHCRFGNGEGRGP